MSAVTLTPFFENVQAHYDLSNEFFFLFLDPSRMYSCAYFARPGMSLEDAQLAKLDLALGKCNLRPGQRLLDIGCGWGGSCRRAAEKYGVHVTGLTLSKNQYEYCQEQFRLRPVTAGSVTVQLRGWEQFDEPVDRIVSIASFEAYRRERYHEFFSRCCRLLPDDGRMLLHTIVWPDWKELERRGIPVEYEHVLFYKFLCKEIFPGGQLCPASEIIIHCQQAGLEVTHTESLQPHYVRTLRIWAENLEQERDQAVEIVGREVYDRYMKYLTGCARYFETGHVDVMQFTLRPA